MPIFITRGIFSSEWKAWAAVAAYTVLLYGTLTVAFDLYTAVYGRLGEVEMSQSINRVFLVAGLALLGFIVLGLPRKVRSYLVFGLILPGRGCLSSGHHHSRQAPPPVPVLAPDDAGLRRGSIQGYEPLSLHLDHRHRVGHRPGG